MESFGDVSGRGFSNLRCFHHVQREAVARCVGCGRFFCRECVSEHKSRLLCAQCLGAEARAGQKRDRHLLAPVQYTMRFLLGLLLAWASFYTVGKVLLQIPSEFHDSGVSLDLSDETDDEAEGSQ